MPTMYNAPVIQSYENPNDCYQAPSLASRVIKQALYQEDQPYCRCDNRSHALELSNIGSGKDLHIYSASGDSMGKSRRTVLYCVKTETFTSLDTEVRHGKVFTSVTTNVFLSEVTARDLNCS